MSRVARKRLEKEAKRKRRRLLFGMNKAKSTDVKIEKTEIVDEVPKKEKPKQNEVKSGDSKIENNNRKVENSAQDIDFCKSFSSASFEEGDTMVAKPQKMKTADRIISVEDERMYYERKKNRVKKGLPAEEDVLTVNDIHTAEEEGQNVEKAVNGAEGENIKPEKNINEIKRLNIEDAPFKDVVKVAESRLEAEKERKRIEKAKQKRLEEEVKRQKELLKMEQLRKEKEEKLKEKEVGKVEDKDVKKDNQETLSDKDSAKKSESDAIVVGKEEAKKEKERRLREQIEREMKEKLAELNSEKESEQKEAESSEENKEEVEEKAVEENEEKTDESTTEEDSSEEEKDDINNKEYQEEYEYEKEERKGRFKNFIKKFFKYLGIAVVVVYVLGCVVFYNRFFVNTKVNGMNVGFMTPAKVDELAKDRVNGYKIIIEGRNNVKDELSGKDVDMRYIEDGSAKKVKKEQGFLGWPLALFNDEVIDGKLSVEIDENKLKDKVKDFNIFKKEHVKAPVSAYPRYDEKKKDLVVDKGDLGSTPIESKVVDFVSDSVKSEALNAKYPNSVYKPQKNKADDPRIKRAIAEMKKYTGMKVVYDFGYEKYTLDGKEISKMFDVDSENDYKVKFNKEKVRDFVRSLSRKYSTYGDTRVIPSASTGGNLKVSGGVYGWLIDRDGETDELVKIIQNGKDVENRKPLYKQTAMSRDKNDLGNEFIEIDLSKQYMWFVRDGKAIVETPIVSGNPNQGDATPPGIYPITYKTRNAVLRGPGYASPVSYWIPFNGNIGIHDASWQPIYGGNRYLYAGSHGCINTPYSKVAEIYKLSKEGMPVVVHY
nr:L,D-transpeptidase family protein [uncultured Peptostreptococcus sp.]